VLTLLWGVASEEPLAAVADALEAQGSPTFLLDQRLVLGTELQIHGECRGFAKAGATRVELEQITACYVRPYDSRRLPAIQETGPYSEAAAHAAYLEDALLAWLEVTPALVVNLPSTMLANGSKPYQLELIGQAGFSIPRTLVTTDPQAVERFVGECREVVYKSVSGVRSRVTRFSPSHVPRLGDVVNCPTQFQEYIQGCDYRAHVIGDDVFSCRIQSEADDYRYAGGGRVPPRITADRLPCSVEERLLNMTKDMRLHVAGIDLRRTPDDEWFCFEVNPSPAFTFYEHQTGQGIARAIALLLTACRSLQTG
jgi:hypothetical protein